MPNNPDSSKKPTGQKKQPDDNAPVKRLDRAKNLLSAFIDKLKTDRKTQIITAVSTAVIIGGLVFIPPLFKEKKGSWKYAVCKVVAERYVRYPMSVDILAAGETSNGALVYFSKRNAFGDERLHLLECNYGKDKNGIFLKTVTLDDKPMDPDYIEKISATLPAILSQKDSFYLELPAGFSLRMEKFKDRNPVTLDKVYIRSRYK